ncbi:Kinesin-3 [Dactylella cylindrospora]|nr:Kinesin-3 [Dactylella cylindrospora]
MRPGTRGLNRKQSLAGVRAASSAPPRPPPRPPSRSGHAPSRPAYLNPAVQAIARPSSPTESIASTTATHARTEGRHRSPDETNVQVVVRCRGRSEREIKENSQVILSTPGGPRGNEVQMSMGPMSLANKSYTFDRVFGPEADQSMIYDDVVAPIVGEMLSGFNCTIFAYGQTGTGKTYTMSGDMEDYFGTFSDGAGIIPRTLHKLFERLDAEASEYSVKCSFIELYNEELRDLLSTDDAVKLKMFEDSTKKGGVLIHGMEESYIKTAVEGVSLLQGGSRKRQVAATKCNDLSSRSHTVFTITAHVKEVSEDGEDLLRSGKLNLVDLAGSESIGRSGAENKRAKEAGMINQSLLSLGRVITALVEKSNYIPYRESKLTRLLQDSLGGRTKTCIIATVSPAKVNLEETISTLNYAATAKNIENKPQINQMMTKRALIREYISEIEHLKADLAATRQKHGVFLTEEHYKSLTNENESRKILLEEHERKISVLEGQLRNARENLEKTLKSFNELKKDYDSQTLALEETRDALFSTETSLVITKQELSDEILIAKAHQATEVDLTVKAQNLLSTVGTAVRDIDSLHAKIERKGEMEAQNKVTWNSTRQQTSEVTRLVESEIQKFVEEQAKLSESVTTRMEAFVQLEMEKIAKVYTSLDEGLEHLEEVKQSATGTAREAADEMNLVLEEIKVLRDDVKGKVADGMKSMTEAAEKIAGDVVRELESFKEEIRSSYISLGRDFKGMFDSCSKHLAMQTQKANELKLEVEAANKAAIAAQNSASDTIGAVLAEESQKAAQERQQLLNQITQLITSHAQEQDRRLVQKMSPVQAGLTTSGEKLSGATSTICDTMDQWAETEESFKHDLSTTRDNIKKKLQADAMAAENKTTNIQNTANSIHAETIHLVNAQMKSVAVNMQTLDEFVTRARDQNERHHRLRVTSLDTISEQVKTSNAAVRYNIDDVKQGVEDVSADVTAGNLKCKKALEPFSTNTSRLVAGLRTQTEMAVYRDYVSTQSTPKKREYPFPTELPKTGTREQILAASHSADFMFGVTPEPTLSLAAGSETVGRKRDRVPLGDLNIDPNIALQPLLIGAEKEEKPVKKLEISPGAEEDIDDVSMVQMPVPKAPASTRKLENVTSGTVEEVDPDSPPPMKKRQIETRTTRFGLSQQGRTASGAAFGRENSMIPGSIGRPRRGQQT